MTKKVGRACIGLGLVGQGLAILSGVIPHEEILVGGGLLVFGSVLVATGTLPRFPASRRWHLFALGAGFLGLVLMAWVVSGNAPRGPLLLLSLLGGGMLAAGAFFSRSLRIGRRTLGLRDLAPSAAVAIGVPLLVWVVQAAFKRATGATPLEAFEIAFLVMPVHWILGAMGLVSSMQGQTLTLPGPQGLLAVEVGVACSGLQAMALFMGMLALFALSARPTGRQLALWTVVGIGGVYLANVARLLVVVLAGHRWGSEALLQVHANAGWIFFVAWSLVFALWVRRGLEPHAAPRTHHH